MKSSSKKLPKALGLKKRMAPNIYVGKRTALFFSLPMGRFLFNSRVRPVVITETTLFLQSPGEPNEKESVGIVRGHES